MAKLNEDVKKVFESVKDVAFATADAQGQPNTCVVAMKAIIDDETIYLSDQFFKKTLANLEENQKVSVVFWSKEGAYQIHGTARYVNEGAEFEAQKAWVDAAFVKLGLPIQAKGGCFITVDAVYNTQGGPGAGDQIA